MIVKVRVKPNASSFKVVKKGNDYIIYVPEKPEKGKVNAFIESKLSKMLGCNVRIIRGFKSRVKLLEVDKWFDEGG